MTCAEFEKFLPEIVDGPRTAEQEAHLHSCRDCAGVISDLNFIQKQAQTLQGTEEPGPAVWQAIATTVGQWQSEMDLIAREARQLQGTQEPSPRVWNAIAAELNQWQSEMDEIADEARLLQASADPSPRVWNSLEIALRQEGLIRQPRRDQLAAAGSSRGWRWAWLAPVAAVLVVTGSLVYQKGDGPVVYRQVVARKSMPMAVLSDDEQMLDAVASRAPAMRAVYENNLRNVNAYIHDAEQSVKNDPTDEEAQESLVNAYDQKSMLYEMALDRSLP
ncbi:MAG TPA: hypothetical protein VJQ82_09050 [Terriglobales bacterium]|nr:hypothetical protein [Terriglobales bacterium]